MLSKPEEEGIGKSVVRVSYYPWIVLGLVFGAQLTEALAMLGIPVLYPFIQAELALSRAQVGFITSSSAAGVLVTAFLAGWLTDYVGVKRVMVIALVGQVVLLGLFYIAGSFYVILVLAIFLGVVWSPVYPATTRAIMDWIPGKVRGLAMSLKQTAVPVGGTFTAAILPALALAVGWRLSAALIGIPILLVAILFIPLYHNPSASNAVKPRLDFGAMIRLVHNRSLTITALWGAIYLALNYIILTYFMLFLMEEMQLSPFLAGGLLALAQVTSTFARILWGAVSDFIFHRRRLPVLIATGILATLALLGMSLLGTGFPDTSILLAIIIGISILSWQGVFTALIGEIADEGQVGITTGFANTMMRIAIVVMPPLFGYLVDASGSYELSWRVTALVAFLSTLTLFIFGREPQRQ